MAASAALLTGCGGSNSGQTASGRAALLTTLENWSALQTPVDQALGILTQQCMAQHGYRYYPFPDTGQPGGFNGGQPQENHVLRTLRGRTFATYMKTLYGGGKSTRIRISGMPHFSIRIGGCNTTAGTKLFGSVAASVADPQYGQSILIGSVQSGAARSSAVRTLAVPIGALYASGSGSAYVILAGRGHRHLLVDLGQADGGYVPIVNPPAGLLPGTSLVLDSSQGNYTGCGRP